MRLLLNKIIIICFLLFSSIVLSGTIDDALTQYGFSEREIPREKILHEKNYSKYEFYVHNKLGVINISLISERNRPDREMSFKSKNLEYIGSNRGEWGGELVVKRENGITEELIKDNIVSIKLANDMLYVFTGLSHLMMSRGSVYRISSYETNPIVERYTLLPQAPRIILKDDRNNYGTRFIIISSSGISAISIKYSILHVVTTDLFWGTLYPNSAIQVENKFLIGMRSGVAVVEEVHGQLISVKYYAKSK